MTKASRRAREARIRAACCDTHGFGRNAYGLQQFEQHVRGIVAVVEEARARRLLDDLKVSKATPPLLPGGNGVAQEVNSR